MFNKRIHEDEFRLRILTTNTCNVNCYHCLNDFQSKHGSMFIDPNFSVKYIYEYSKFMRKLNKPSIVTFSGGEPGLHKDLLYMLKISKDCCDYVKVDTNGEAYSEDCFPFVDKWHIHILHIEDVPFVRPAPENIVFQIIVTEGLCHPIGLKKLQHFIQRYPNNKIKLFVDFFGAYENIYPTIEELKKKHSNVETRFTGKQENRGKACTECNLDCVTLKALWLFPNNTASTCPQKMKTIFDDNNLTKDVIGYAYRGHIKE